MKEESDAKRQSLDGRHQFIITAIADKLEMNNNEVEDLLLEGNQVYMMSSPIAVVNSNHCSWKQWMTSLLQMEQSIYSFTMRILKRLTQVRQ